MSSSSSNGASSSFDHILIQSLLSRLQLRPPFLDTNSFLSHDLGDFVNSDSENESDDADEDDDSTRDSKNRKVIAKEEAKLEREIIKIVNSGSGDDLLKPNSGQSVSIGDHNVCVGVHEEKGSEYRVWEWHGHIMFFDEEDGYSAEYVYGNYFERVVEKKKKKKEEEEEEEEVEDGSRVKGEGNSGLRDLIGGEEKVSVGGGIARVVHRNSLNSAGSAAADK